MDRIHITMNEKFILIFLLSMFCVGCIQSPKESQVSYPENVGDISFDENLDDPAFKVCNEQNTFQYYNSPAGFPFAGEKIKIFEIFSKEMDGGKFGNQSGYITIRFVINCEGSSGRFRVQEIDSELKEGKFSRDLVDQLLRITKDLKGWEIASNGVDNFDYYQYLSFKIEEGILTDILP
jgi:hypothetical protein